MDSTTVFLNQISKYEVLDHKTQLEYIKRAQNGDKEYRNKLIEHNLRLVVSIAKRFTGRMELLDLIQAGSMGLNEAIDRFEIEQGNKFTTYAHWWIMQRINLEITSNSRVIRIPAYLSNAIPIVNRERDRLSSMGIKPTAELISKNTDIPLTRVESALNVEKETLSLDYENEENADFKNILEQTIYTSPEKEVIRSERTEAIEEALNTLDPMHKKILILRFGLDKTGKRRTLKEISKIVGLTKERVRQIESASLNILKDSGGRSDRRKKIREYAYK